MRASLVIHLLFSWGWSRIVRLVWLDHEKFSKPLERTFERGIDTKLIQIKTKLGPNCYGTTWNKLIMYNSQTQQCTIRALLLIFLKTNHVNDKQHETKSANGKLKIARVQVLSTIQLNWCDKIKKRDLFQRRWLVMSGWYKKEKRWWLVRVSFRNCLHRPPKSDQDFHYGLLIMVGSTRFSRVSLLLTWLRWLRDAVVSHGSSLSGPSHFGRSGGPHPTWGKLTVEPMPEESWAAGDKVFWYLVSKTLQRYVRSSFSLGRLLVVPYVRCFRSAT